MAGLFFKKDNKFTFRSSGQILRGSAQTLSNEYKSCPAGCVGFCLLDSRGVWFAILDSKASHATVFARGNAKVVTSQLLQQLPILEGFSLPKRLMEWLEPEIGRNRYL